MDCQPCHSRFRGNDRSNSLIGFVLEQHASGFLTKASRRPLAVLYRRGKSIGVEERQFPGRICDERHAWTETGPATNPKGLATVCGDRRREWREVGDRVARLAAGAPRFGAARRACRGPRAQFRPLSRSSISGRLGRRGHRAAQYPMEPAENEDALRDCRPKVLLFDKTFAPIGRRAWAGASRSAARLCRRRCSRPGKRAITKTWRNEASRLPTRCARARTSPASSTPAAPPAARKGVMLSHGNSMVNALNGLARIPGRRRASPICTPRRCSIWPTPARCS